MTIQANGTTRTLSSTTTENYSYSESYSIVYASSTAYKVNITTIEENQSIAETVWVLNNGTALAVRLSGQNFTGPEAQELIVGAFAGFNLQVQADAQIGLYTAPNYFRSVGTSTESVGPTQVADTNYVANMLPETLTGCGTMTTLTAYSFSVGIPKGTSSPLVTYEHLEGSNTVNGQTSTFDCLLRVTSITLVSGLTR
jgi:hypothetical protein